MTTQVFEWDKSTDHGKFVCFVRHKWYDYWIFSSGMCNCIYVWVLNEEWFAIFVDFSV